MKMQCNPMRITPGHTNVFKLEVPTNDTDVEVVVICTVGTFQVNAWGEPNTNSPVLTAGESSDKIVFTTAEDKKVLLYGKAGDDTSSIIVSF